MNLSKLKSGRRHILSFTVCIALLAGAGIFSGCHRQVAAGQVVSDAGPDPADANLAPVDDDQQQAAAPAQTVAPGQPVQNESQQRADEYRRTGTQAGAPVDQQEDQQYAQPDDQQDQSGAYNPDDQNYEDQVDAGQEAIEEADQPPPPLPVYVQPIAPAPNYIWTPGYWGFGPGGFYWVPGAWVAAPYYGALWTPGYWGFYGGRYRFYRGYWGLHIGFYGGIPYGCGYTGYGYHGGYWRGNDFYYNRAVNRVNVTRITNVYNRTVIVNNNTRVSYNGGRGGLQIRPRPAELVAMRGPRTRPMTAQLQNQRQAAQNRQQFFNQNRGRPAMPAIARPLAADKGIQRPVARPIQSPGRPGQSQIRPGQPQFRPQQPAQIRPGQPQIRPVQPNQMRPGQPQIRPEQPNQVRPGQPQIRPVEPNRPEMRPNQPQVRPVQPQRPEQPQRPVQPQFRPQIQQPRPQPQIRPMPERAEPRPMPQPRPEQSRPEMRPMPQQPRPEMRPMPQQRQEMRPMPQQRPQPQSRPAPQARPQQREAPRGENRQQR